VLALVAEVDKEAHAELTRVEAEPEPKYSPLGH